MGFPLLYQHFSKFETQYGRTYFAPDSERSSHPHINPKKSALSLRVQLGMEFSEQIQFLGVFSRANT